MMSQCSTGSSTFGAPINTHTKVALQLLRGSLIWDTNCEDRLRTC